MSRAALWWRATIEELRLAGEFASQAKAAEQKETGHDCGHTWEIAVHCRGHYGMAGEGPETHSDDGYHCVVGPVQVRAHDLPTALLLAAVLDLDEWMGSTDQKAES